MDGRVTLEIFCYIIGRCLAGNAELPCQAEIGNAVNDTKVDGLCVRPLFGRDVFERNPQHFGCRSPMDILFIDERFDEAFVPRHVGKNA